MALYDPYEAYTILLSVYTHQLRSAASCQHSDSYKINGQQSASIYASHRSLAAPREVFKFSHDAAFGVRSWSLPHGGCLKLEVLSSQLVYVSKSTMSNSIQRYNATAM